MTKLDLQKELLEKVKPGTKPSDIKKQVKRSQMPVSQDEGYESDQSSSSSKTSPNQTQELQIQLTSLKKQLQLYKDFREADLKVKEDYKQTIKDLQTKNSELNKTIQELKNQAKNPTKPQPKELQPKQYLFTCSICDQNKKSPLHLAKVNGLGINPTKLQKICDYCIKRVDIIKEREEEFF